MNTNQINDFFDKQLSQWTFARKNYEALRNAERKKIKTRKITLTLQHNPERILSSDAKIDAESLASRACFLCNLPSEQIGIELFDTFKMLVNPYPILQKHFTIINQKHTPQRIVPYLSDFIFLAEWMGKNYTLFYNGPECGASAPDHMHFQAGLSEEFAIWESIEKMALESILTNANLEVKAFECHVNGFLVSSKDRSYLPLLLEGIVRAFADFQAAKEEPMLNILLRYVDDTWHVILFPRERHRPWQYYEEEGKRIVLSPASVDYSGLLAIPRKEDFERLDAKLLKDIFEQLSLNSTNFQLLKNKISKL